MRRKDGRAPGYRTDLERAELEVIETHKKCKAMIDRIRSRSTSFMWLIETAREAELALRECRKTLKRECAAERLRGALVQEPSDD